MVLNVLNHIPDVLTYLSKLKTQPIFMFCAIPQVMAIATLALVFNNLQIYERNIKIRKGEAVRLILDSSNMDSVVAIFRKYVFEIARKNDACDPNFMEISMAVGKVSECADRNMDTNFSRLSNGFILIISHQAQSKRNNLIYLLLFLLALSVYFFLLTSKTKNKFTPYADLLTDKVLSNQVIPAKMMSREQSTLK